MKAVDCSILLMRRFETIWRMYRTLISELGATVYQLILLLGYTVLDVAALTSTSAI